MSALKRPFENMVTGYRLEYEGQVWQIDAKAFYRKDGTVTLKVYRVHGDINSPLLYEALEVESAVCGLAA